MLLSSFPDLLSFQRNTRMTGQIKARLELVSGEAVTGRRSDVTEAANGDVGGLHLMQKALDDIEQDGRINSITGSRLGLMRTSLTSVREAIGDLSAEGFIATYTDNEFNISTLATQADVRLRSAMSLLNISHGTRKLFAGDATDQTALVETDTLLTDVRAIMTATSDPADVQIALDTYFNDPTGGFYTNIYKGGDANVAPSFLADGTKVEFGIRADNQALRDTLRGLAVMAVAQGSGHPTTSAEFKNIFIQGTESLSKGTSNIIKLESQIGIHENLIETMNSQQADERLSLSIAVNSITGRDQYDAATELKQLEAQLEASYLLTSRLSNLNLTNFLR